jgi:hypothetical protein
MSAADADPIETAETPFVRARAHAAKVEGILLSEEMNRKTHSELEEMLDGQGKEWARLMLEEGLRLRAEVERRNAVVGADGGKRKYPEPAARTKADRLPDRRSGPM